MIGNINNIVIALTAPAAKTSPSIPDGNPITFDGIYDILSGLANFLWIISGTVMVIAIILSGLLMIWSRGEEGIFKKGKEMLKTTIWGAFIIFGGGVIFKVIRSIFDGTFSLSPAQDIIVQLSNFIIGLAGVVMITFVVISGIMMSTAGQNQEKFKKARQMLTNVIWGSLVIMGSGVIINTVYAVVTRTFFCQVSVLGICLWG